MKKTIKDMVYAEAHKRRLDIKEHDGELSAIVAFTEQIAENAIDGMFDMYTDGLIIGKKEK